MRDPSGMSADELAELLSKLRGELEEIEEERIFVLSQTGLHVSAGEVSKYEGEIHRLKTSIMEVERVISDERAERTEPGG
jgi:hypothetical protein